MAKTHPPSNRAAQALVAQAETKINTITELTL